MNPVSHGARRALSIAAAVALVAGCHGGEQAVAGSITDPRDVAVETSLDSPHWNRFEADVVVTTEGAAVQTLPKQRVTLGASYRLVRYRDANGRWTTEHTFADFLPRTTGDGPDPSRVARVVSAPGRPPVFYDANGRPISLPSRASVPPEMGRAAAAPVALAGTVAALRSTADDTSSAWAEHFVVTPSTASRVRARLLRQSGQPAALAAGRVRFTQRRGRLAVEVELDAGRGTVAVTRLLDGGRMRQEVTREYITRGDGTHVLARERVTRFDERGAALPGTIVRTYRNVRILGDR
jgi:hypothetical protein